MKTCRRGFTAIFSVLAFHCLLSISPAEGLERKLVTKTDIGTIDFSRYMEKSGCISPDGRHAACVLKDKQKFRVWQDGKEGDAYDKISGNLIWFSPDSKHSGYLASKGDKWYSVIDGRERSFPGYPVYGSRIVWSNDSKRWVFTSQVDDGKAVMCDGSVEGPYSDVTDLAFSSDSKKLGYRAQIGGSPWVETVVVDGKKNQEWGKVVPGTFQFSPNGKKYAYWAFKEDLYFIVMNNKVLGRDAHLGIKKEIFEFSPDSRKLYAVVVDPLEFEHLVINGRMLDKALLKVPQIAFSDNGKKTVWVGRSGGKWMVYINGRKHRAYETLMNAEMKFSPDGKLLAIRAGTDKGAKRFYSINKKDEKTYSQLFRLVFSPDSKHYAYVAKGEDGMLRIVRDGKETCAVQDFRPGTLRFSSNSVNLAVCAGTGEGKRFAVVNGKKGKEYADIFRHTLRFSPDGGHCLYMAKTGDGWTLVVDGVEGAAYDFCWAERIHFVTDTKFHYMVVHDGHCCVIEEELAEK